MREDIGLTITLLDILLEVGLFVVAKSKVVVWIVIACLRG
jgi:hypothetical protein